MSLTSARLNYLMKECYNRNDLGGALDAFSSYQASQCYFPTKQYVYDSHTQTDLAIDIPCGKCYHCLETKINSWVTRMYAHLENFNHVYFITLTYRSFTPFMVEGFPQLRPLEQLLQDKLTDAVWHYDNKNASKRYCYSPCLLVKSHYQNFIKRLRKNTGINDLTYVLTGEYGSNYGRPHFHAILFSNSEISYTDVRRAWSISMWRDNSGTWTYRRNQRYNGSAFDFPIGNVDFHDLITNGTLNTAIHIKVDNNIMSAAHCFAYVCKYVCKSDDANYTRVHLAFNNLFIDELMCNDPALGIQPFHVSVARCEHLFIESLLLIYQKNSYYEKIPFPSLQLAGKINYRENKSSFGFVYSVERYPTYIKDFCNKFAPFVEFSRGCPIGSIYAKSHLSEFTQGVFNKPILQERGFVVPSYFRRKAQEHVYGLRKMHKTIRSTSFVKTGLIDLYRRLESADLEITPLFEIVPCYLTSKDYDSLLRDPDYSFKDLSEGTRVLLLSGRAKSFTYNRHLKKFVCVRQVPISDWIRTQCERLRADFKNYYTSIRDIEQSKAERDEALSNLCSLSGKSISILRQEFANRQDVYLKNKQRLYDSTHFRIE